MPFKSSSYTWRELMVEANQWNCIINQRLSTVLPFSPKYRLDHPENYLFVLSQKNAFWIKVSENKRISFLKKLHWLSTLEDNCGLSSTKNVHFLNQNIRNVANNKRVRTFLLLSRRNPCMASTIESGRTTGPVLNMMKVSILSSKPPGLAGSRLW